MDIPCRPPLQSLTNTYFPSQAQLPSKRLSFFHRLAQFFMRYRIALAIAATMSIIGLAAALKFHKPTRNAAATATAKVRATYTVDERVAQYGKDVATRLGPAFLAAGVAYPPHEIAYLAFKDQRRLQVYARNTSNQPWRYVKQYDVLAASGVPGPKLVEGDRQVPEGIYKAEFLNANSRFHLSIRLNYPNDFDRRMAQRDERTRLGGDIMIHGSFVSVGCLAMGDEAAEDLFILSALSEEPARIVVSPADFRAGAVAVPRRASVWVPELYDALRSELRQYPRPPV